MTQRSGRTGRLRLTRTTTAAALGAAVLLAACGGRSDEKGTAQSGKPIVWAVNADVTGLDPHNNGQDTTRNILSFVYQHLVTLADGVHLSPELAKSYRQVSPTVYEFTLRSGVKFSNGRAMTAADVVGSFERILSEKEASYLRGRLTAVKSVKALDAQTVEFRLSRPYSDLLPALTDPAAVVLPMKELDAGTFDPTKALMGTGPYMAARHQQGNSWTFTKNPYYWEPGLPKVGQVRIVVLPDEGTQVAALRSGAANIATFSNSGAPKLVAGVPGVRTVSQESSKYYVLVLNKLRSPQLKSTQTRQGVNLAVDRSQIRSVALDGVGSVVGPAPGLPESCPVSSLPFSKADATKAVQTLQAGGRPSTPLNLIYDTVIPDQAGIAQVIKSQLARVGVAVNLRPLPDGQYLKDLVGGDFDLGLTYYGSGADPYFSLINWDPELTTFTAKFNAPIPEVETALPLIASASGQTRRSAIDKVCVAIDEDSGQIPLVSKTLTIAWNKTRLDADILGAENGTNPLRNIARYTTK